MSQFKKLFFMNSFMQCDNVYALLAKVPGWEVEFTIFQRVSFKIFDFFNCLKNHFV